MTKYSVRFALFSVVLWLGVGCSSKPRAPERPVYGPQVPSYGPGPGQVGPGQTPPQEIPTVEAPKPLERPRITLVVGGAGVASVALVGALKRFQEEGIVVESIVATGWPALFALGYGFLPSIHDVEWFAMRLQQKDFYKSGLWDFGKENASQAELGDFLKTAFPQNDLSESRVPVIVAATNVEWAEPQIFERGDWREALLKTMAVPGIFRPYPQADGAKSVSSIRGLDVDEALRRGASRVVALSMYDDYFRELARKGGAEAPFRQMYLGQLRSSLRQQLKSAHFSGNVMLNKAPDDFGAKRAAIQAGYREATRLSRLLKSAPRT